MPDNFTTHDVLELIERGRSNSSDLAQAGPISLKKMSGKLNRLCCMRLLARTKVTRVAFTKTGNPCFRGYKYRYRITKQGHSYIKYRLEMAKLGNSDGRATLSSNRFNPPSTRSIDDMLPIVTTAGLINASQIIDQLRRALEEEQKKNRYLEKSASQDNAILAAIIDSARKVVLDRNMAIRKLEDVLILVADHPNSPLDAEIMQNIRALVKTTNILPGWMP